MTVKVYIYVTYEKIYDWKQESKIIDSSALSFKMEKNLLKSSMDKFLNIASDYIITSIYNEDKNRVS